MAISHPDTAGIAIPPPLIYLTFFVIGVGLNEWRPVDLLPSLLQHSVGGVIILASFGIAVPAALAFHRARTPIDVRKPPTALVTRGMFKWTRNPLYLDLGLALLHVGMAVTIDNVWALAMAVPAVAAVDRLVIAREELFLERKFGAEYLAYKDRTRRWL
jgi:protein-S-isoprenylcysteine O-methyltransferase Ste14